MFRVKLMMRCNSDPVRFTAGIAPLRLTTGVRLYITGYSVFWENGRGN